MIYDKDRNMAKEYIAGKRQEIVAGASGDMIYWEVPYIDGMPTNPGTSPTLVIADWGVSAAMTACQVVDVGMLSYDAMTSRFTVGSRLTGGSSGATAIITAIYESGTTGILVLDAISGEYADDEALTDNGPGAGSATADGVLWSRRYYYEIDASSISPETGVVATVQWTGADGITRTDRMLIDAVMYPYDPIISSHDIDQAHPDWAAMRATSWSSWWPAIQAGHAELSRRIAAGGRRAALIVDREKLRPVEMAFIEREIASRSTRMTMQEREYWHKRAEAAYSAMGELEYDEDDDGAADANIVQSSRFTR